MIERVQLERLAVHSDDRGFLMEVLKSNDACFQTIKQTTNTEAVVVMGERSPGLLAIPIGVAHGYRVLGNEPAGPLHHATEAYDPADLDEERIAFDDPTIGFDWTTRPRWWA